MQTLEVKAIARARGHSAPCLTSTKMPCLLTRRRGASGPRWTTLQTCQMVGRLSSRAAGTQQHALRGRAGQLQQYPPRSGAGATKRACARASIHVARLPGKVRRVVPKEPALVPRKNPRASRRIRSLPRCVRPLPSSERVKHGKVQDDSHGTLVAGDTNSRGWCQVAGIRGLCSPLWIRRVLVRVSDRSVGICVPVCAPFPTNEATMADRRTGAKHAKKCPASISGDSQYPKLVDHHSMELAWTNSAV